MKFTAAFFLAVAATVSAQDAERRSIKEQLMEHRRDMFQHRAVSFWSEYYFLWWFCCVRCLFLILIQKLLPPLPPYPF